MFCIYIYVTIPKQKSPTIIICMPTFLSLDVLNVGTTMLRSLRQRLPRARNMFTSGARSGLGEMPNICHNFIVLVKTTHTHTQGHQLFTLLYNSLPSFDERIQ